jgi:hypothetical protein
MAVALMYRPSVLKDFNNGVAVNFVEIFLYRELRVFRRPECGTLAVGAKPTLDAWIFLTTLGHWALASKVSESWMNIALNPVC